MTRGRAVGRGRPLALAAALGAALAVAAPSAAQVPTRPWAEWRTIRTDRFVVHYPADLAGWAESTASRLESIGEAVGAFVGYEPDEPTTVIVDDPFGVPNGSAWPGRVVLLWPEPPDPSSMLARSRSWSELLAVHELTHVAHVERPSRNPWDRRLRRLLPVSAGPILTRAPRWALEGYATLVEGRLTGSGRPHGAWRAAVLRSRALAGTLPDYEALDRVDGFLGGSMAYLVGSAYLEWLAGEEGSAEALPKVWRRLTARQRRGFDEAFAGVFGGPPAERYGRFRVALVERALAVEDAVEAAGVERGEWVQRLEGWSADPAVSPDGERLAIVRQPAWDDPPEVLVWSTTEDTLTTREKEAEARLLERDPQDVPAVEWRPRPRRTRARLAPSGGRGWSRPRWSPDGASILVVRAEALGDGRFRPDLWEWRWREGALRRVTEGAAIREADPEPGGRTAVGTRCPDGACDLVRIDLASGAVSVLVDGVPGGRSFHGPRAGPDGRIVVSVRDAGGWRLALLDPDARELRTLSGPERPVRFDAEWAGADAVVAVSEAGGIHDLERIDVRTGEARRLTRVVTAALDPAPAPDGGVFFLHLTARGLDLRRVDGRPVAEAALALDPDLAPAAAVPVVEAPVFAAAELPPSTPYGIGPRSRVALPAGYAGPEGWAVGAVVHGSDPVGRLGWELGGLAGTGSGWRGGSASAVWRGERPEIRVRAFRARQAPSRQDLDGVPVPVPDATLTGGEATLEVERVLGASRYSARAGGSVARVDAELPEAARPGGAAPDGPVTRSAALAELAGAWLQAPGRWRIVERVRLHGAAGSTDGEGWRRGVLGAGFEVGRDGSGLALEALYGRTDPGPGGFEAFAVGGGATPLFDPAVLSQRLPDPALPVGWATGTEAASVRVAWRSPGGETYYRWVSAGSSIGDWKRVVGTAIEWRTDPVPFLGLPAIDVGLGVARIFDDPLDGDTRIHAHLRYRP